MRNPLQRINIALPAAMLALCIVGVLFIYSASYNPSARVGNINFAVKQILWIAVGFIMFLMAAFMDYRKLRSTVPFLYWAGVLLLVAVFVFGSSRLGAQRWISIMGFNLQPSELMKCIAILSVAGYISSRKKEGASLWDVIMPFAIISLPVILIVKQPDLGTSLIILPTVFMMIFAGGARLKHLAYVCGAFVSCMPFMWFMLHDYQKKRVKVFLNPNLDPLGSGYTAIQAKIAVGSGQMAGKGFLHGSQTQLNFLPEKHTDFIFAVVAEEWGFAGSLIILFLYGVMLTLCITTAMRTKDVFGRLICVGVASMIAAHVLINIGMNIGLMPITGIPLPFLSYGGSSIIMLMASLGLVESVSRRRYVF